MTHFWWKMNIWVTYDKAEKIEITCGLSVAINWKFYFISNKDNEGELR